MRARAAHAVNGLRVGRYGHRQLPGEESRCTHLHVLLPAFGGQTLLRTSYGKDEDERQNLEYTFHSAGYLLL